jgi:hypothetical protein
LGNHNKRGLPAKTEELKMNKGKKTKSKYKEPPVATSPIQFLDGEAQRGILKNLSAQVLKEPALGETEISVEIFKSYCTSNRLQAGQDKEWAFSELATFAKGATPFAALDRHQCRDYDMSREIVLLEREYKKKLTIPDVRFEWVEDRVKAIRKNWQITGFTSSVKENPTWFSSLCSRVLVLYPEWPDLPYLAIDEEERLRRMQELCISILDPTDSAPDEERKAIENQWLANSENLLNPWNLAIAGKRQMIITPKGRSHEELIKAYKDFLEVNFPEQGKEGLITPAKIAEKYGLSVAELENDVFDKKDLERWIAELNKSKTRQGRASEESAVADDLNKLAAHRLCRRARFPRAKVIEIIKHPQSQAQVYSAQKLLDRPLKLIRHRLKEFWFQTLGDLTPIEPLGLSQPDFSLL